jgi:hypothetical protein
MNTTQHQAGTRVTYQYRLHQMLGGALMSGSGVVLDWTIVGTSRAYVIKPDAGDVVHVRFAGVRAA